MKDNDLELDKDNDLELDKDDDLELDKDNDLELDKDNDLELDKDNDLEKKYLDKILRLNAEIENINKRNLIEMEKIYKYSLEKFFIEFLPVIDNLERTENELKNNNININIIKEGIELTIKLLMKIINKFGIKIINDINVPLNPNIHQAVITVESDSIENNYILEVMQKGYLLNDRLIRPSMVKVSINKKS